MVTCPTRNTAQPSFFASRMICAAHSRTCDTLPGAVLSVSCDLTKLHEKTIRGTAQEVLDALKANPKAEKGEYCLVLDFHAVTLPEEAKPAADVSLEARLTDLLLEDLTLRDAQSELVLQGEKNNAVKAAALRLKKLLTEEI